MNIRRCALSAILAIGLVLGVPRSTRANPILVDGFTLTSAGDGTIALAWTPGSGQSTYKILRYSATGPSILLTLPGFASSATEHLANGQAACYAVLGYAVNGQQVSSSRILCAMSVQATSLRSSLSVHFGPPPPSCTFECNPTVVLEWAPVPGATAMLLDPINNALRLQLLPGTATSATDTGGCYLVIGFGSDGAPLWISDAVCGYPAIAG